MRKILVGGFLHETNTFSPVVTDYDNFAVADEWPGISRHAVLLENFKNKCNIPISGFLAEAKLQKFNCIPSVWASASPSGKVTESAYEKITAMLLEDIQNNPDIDGIFLDLHGAMVTTHLDDGEGELLKRIRDIVGPLLPIVIALDFHANLSQAMLKHATQMHIYKTYPHMDMYETGQRSAQALTNIIYNEHPPFGVLRQLDFLVPLNAQCTLIEPLKSLYTQLDELIANENCIISLAPGFALSDIKDAGLSFVVYATSFQQANEVADKAQALITSVKNKFKLTLYECDEAIRTASSIKDKPVIFADTQDNSGGGGTSDTMGIFKSLVKNQTKNAVVLMILDKEIAQKAHAAGIGAEITCALGEKSSSAIDKPFEGTFKIKNLSNGKFDATPGSYYEGFHVNCGLMAYLEYEGIGALVGSQKMQAADRAMLTHMGFDPKSYDLLVLKSSVHFRADFMRLSDHIFIVKSPGKVTADLTELHYKNNNKERL